MPTPHKIRVDFIDKNEPVEPPDGQEIADAIRKELESLHPTMGDVVARQLPRLGAPTGYVLGPRRAVQGGVGVTSAKNA